MPIDARNEHWDPEFEKRQELMRKGRSDIGQFAVDQATDPMNYLGLGGGMFGKALGKAAVGSWAALKGSDAEATVYGRPAKEAISLFEKIFDDMVQKGASATQAKAEAFKASGVYKASDGEWRGYIPDKGARVNQEGMGKLGKWTRAQEMLGKSPTAVVPLNQAFSHPELFKKFPSLSDINVALLPKNMDKTIQGVYSPSKNTVYVRPGLSEKETMDVVLHETQHVIQNRTGIKGGTNMGSFLPKGREGMHKADAALASVGGSVKKQMEDLGISSPLSRNNVRQAVDNMMAGDARQLTQMRSMYGGKDPEKFDSIVRQLMDTMKAQSRINMKKKEAFDKYMRSYGEAEARMTPRYADRNLRDTGSIPDDLMQMDPDLAGKSLLMDY